jgi:hypothetical protein
VGPKVCGARLGAILSLFCSGGPFDLCEAESRVLIGLRFCTLDRACSFHVFSAQLHLHTCLDQHLWNLLDKHPILLLDFFIILFLCKI